MKPGEQIKPANYSPLDPIEHVLVCNPGIPASQALLLPPEKSLFETTAPNNTSIVTARRDHYFLRETLSNEGISVIDLAVVLGQALEPINKIYTTKDKLLRAIHSRSINIQKTESVASPDSFERTMDEMDEILESDIDSMGSLAAFALNAVLTRLIDLDGRELDQSDKLPPIGNLLFSRDNMHVTGELLGTNRMRWPIRRPEVALAEIALKKLGIEFKPLPTHDEKATLEGGDILPVELGGLLYALIGQAERTSPQGVAAWYKLHQDAWDKGVVPLVISGPKTGTQDQMHLDTWFQQVAKSAAIHCGEITRARTLSELRMKDGRLQKINICSFYDWINSNFDHVYDMTREEQLKYAPNVLVHGTGNGKTTVFVSRADSPNVTDFIKKHSKIVPMHIAEITKLYGAAHCASQEFRQSR